MKILGLDSAHAACSAALMADGAIRARRFQPMARGHAEALMPMVVGVLADAGCVFAELDLIAVTIGPGAFTGLRIGLAAARAMALAAKLPCLGVTTLEAVAHATRPAEREGATLVVALSTRRSDVYVQAFDASLAPLGAPAAVAAEAIAVTLPPLPVVVAGDAAGEVVAALAGAGIAARPSAAPALPDAAHVAALAAERFRAGAPPPAPPAPLYLHAPAVTLPGRK